jgi:hypothetical protein
MATLSTATDSDAAKGELQLQKELPMEIHGSLPLQFFF